MYNLVRNLPPEQVTVLAPRWEGWREFDARQPFRVRRWAATSMWPTRELARRVTDLATESGSEVVIFGHGLPLAVLGPSLAGHGLPYVVVTHGAEYWMALAPATASALRRACSAAARVTVISRFTGRTIRTVVPDHVPVSLLPPGVDVDRFRPDVSGDEVRTATGVNDRPSVVCVSRLVPRKGQDLLILAMDRIRRREPDAVLLIVGDGKYRGKLEAMASYAPRGSVSFAGAVADAELPAYHAAADVFAMPCRSRFAGLEVEGFGIVFLEAAASGKPSIAGSSGGAAEAVVDGTTGLVVDGASERAVAEAVSALLADPARAAALGKAGRARAEREFSWPVLAGTVGDWLAEAAGGGRGAR